MLVMSTDGLVHDVNEAFTTAYGYLLEDLKGKHFRVLYLEKDQITQRPEIELNTTHREGASTDENYLVHKDGTPIWVTGESILIQTDTVTCIVKIIHNIHAQKQLERYLLTSHELLDNLFESVQQTGLLLLDTQLRTVKSNGVFNRFFSLKERVIAGIRPHEIPHSFWQEEELRNDLRNAVVNHQPINKEYLVKIVDEEGFDKLHIVSKLIHSEALEEKQLLLVIKKA